MDKQILYNILIKFKGKTGREDVQAINLIEKLTEFGDIIRYEPENIYTDKNSCIFLRKHGFEIKYASKLNQENIKSIIQEFEFVKETFLTKI